MNHIQVARDLYNLAMMAYIESEGMLVPSMLSFRRRISLGSWSRNWWLQVHLKLRDDAVEQVCSHIGAGDGVCLARIDLQVIRNLGFNELLNELNGILDVHIVVAGTLDEQEMAFEPGG